MIDHVQLRDVVTADLPIFFEQQLDPEATQMADFPSRDRDAFMTHWTTKVLHNAGGNKNHALRIDLKGLADNKTGLGTKIENWVEIAAAAKSTRGNLC